MHWLKTMARSRTISQALALLLLVSNSMGQEIMLTAGREFVGLMRSLSGPLNMTLDIPAGAVVNVSEALTVLPAIVGPGFADSGLLELRGPPWPAPPAVLDLGHLRDVSVSALTCCTCDVVEVKFKRAPPRAMQATLGLLPDCLGLHAWPLGC